MQRFPHPICGRQGLGYFGSGDRSAFGKEGKYEILTEELTRSTGAEGCSVQLGLITVDSGIQIPRCVQSIPADGFA